jgi:sodium-dependent dicarboxylate transporter 2/3/5
MLQPVELEIELFCRGMRLSEASGRRITRTRAGLGSGLEIVIPAKPKDIWMNVPVTEQFATKSPFLLDQDTVIDTRDGSLYPIRIPVEPAWYSRDTAHGTPMHRIGILQGTYLGIYVGARCIYWSQEIDQACQFCTTGVNVGKDEEARKRVEDVVEVARAAQEESGSVFTHFNAGYHWEDRDDRADVHGVRMIAPYVKAVRQRVGGFIGVQAVPVPSHRFQEYDDLIAAGVDHFSFCYEFEDPEWFARLCPGKANTVGQKAFFDAMEYTSRALGRGRVSGEIIAGVEPIEATKRGVDRIVNAGAFPTVCIFRPTVGSAMEHYPSPDPEAMKEVFAYLHEACRRVGLPVGILPIEVSLVVQAEEAGALVPPTLGTRAYKAKNWALRQLAKPYVTWKMRPS